MPFYHPDVRAEAAGLCGVIVPVGGAEKWPHFKALLQRGRGGCSFYICLPNYPKLLKNIASYQRLKCFFTNSSTIFRLFFNFFFYFYFNWTKPTSPIRPREAAPSVKSSQAGIHFKHFSQLRDVIRTLHSRIFHHKCNPRGSFPVCEAISSHDCSCTTGQHQALRCPGGKGKERWRF